MAAAWRTRTRELDRAAPWITELKWPPGKDAHTVANHVPSSFYCRLLCTSAVRADQGVGGGFLPTVALYIKTRRRSRGRPCRTSLPSRSYMTGDSIKGLHLDSWNLLYCTVNRPQGRLRLAAETQRGWGDRSSPISCVCVKTPFRNCTSLSGLIITMQTNPLFNTVSYFLYTLL